MKSVLCVLILFLTLLAYGQIDPERQKQLDSLVTNIPREILRDLDSVHNRIHSFGNSDEERVFMFYGLIAIHFRYDYKRAGNSKLDEYTPAYTCSKKSGVCRDFSALFLDLCTRSTIPCLEAGGRTKPPLKKAILDYLTLRWRKPNHIWNIVKYNGSWHLMDATWSHVRGVEKYYTKNKDGRNQYAGKAKRADRRYYDATPEFFYRKRSAVHPAFYLSDSVYTYKSVRRTVLPKKLDSCGYAYSRVLDSLAQNPWYMFSKEYTGQQDAYTKYDLANWYISYANMFVDLKRPRTQALDESACEAYLHDMEALDAYLHLKDGESQNLYTMAARQKVDEYLTKMKRRQQRMAQM